MGTGIIRSLSLARKLTFLAVILNTGCSGGNSTVAPPPFLNSTTRQAGDLELAVSVSKTTYAHGETIPLAMTVKNISSHNVALTYSVPTAQPIVSKNNIVIWTAVAVANSVDRKLLAPGETTTFTGLWDLNTDAGLAPDAGAYSLQSYFHVISINDVSVGGVQAAINTYYTNPVSIGIYESVL